MHKSLLVLAVILTLSFGAALVISIASSDAEVACVNKGGVPLNANGTIHCFKKDFFIE